MKNLTSISSKHFPKAMFMILKMLLTLMFIVA